MYLFFIYFFVGLILIILLTKLWIQYFPTKEIIKSFLLHHQHKDSTPNKGGIMIFLSLIPFFIMTKQYILFIITFCGFCIGLWDDLQKKQGGLNNSVRIILWYIIGISIGFYNYYLYGGQVFLPILHIYLNFHWFYIPLMGFFFVGAINGINMTDGLDGMLTFPLILNVLFISIVVMPNNILLFNFTGGCLGVLMGFLYMNIYQAKIFMSNSGSILLGSLLISLFIFTKIECFFFITGGVFILNIISSFLQVISIKYFNRRIFRMAPLHHHFELCGYTEANIVFYVWWVSLLFFVIALSIYFT
jgi:phospho-N-acetylmuramoyl-pentapeptide-transferase